jgi:hypothetical protein
LMLIPFLGGSLLQRLWRGEQAPES